MRHLVEDLKLPSWRSVAVVVRVRSIGIYTKKSAPVRESENEVATQHVCPKRRKSFEILFFVFWFI